MIINEDAAFVKEVRVSVMQIMACALRMYEKTNDEKFLEQAKFFGDFSRELKKLPILTNPVNDVR